MCKITISNFTNYHNKKTYCAPNWKVKPADSDGSSWAKCPPGALRNRDLRDQHASQPQQQVLFLRAPLQTNQRHNHKNEGTSEKDLRLDPHPRPFHIILCNTQESQRGSCHPSPVSQVGQALQEQGLHHHRARRPAGLSGLHPLGAHPTPRLRGYIL